MGYKTKTEQRLYMMNRNSKLRTIVPTPNEYRAMDPKLRHKYQTAVANWYSKSPSRKAAALAKFTQLGMYEWRTTSLRSINNIANMYGNLRNISLAANDKRYNEGIMNGTYKAQYGSGYKSDKTRNQVARYMAFKATPARVLKSDVGFVKGAMTTYVFYSADADENGHNRKSPALVMTDQSKAAKNGSIRGTSIHIFDGYDEMAKVMDDLDKQGLLYIDEVEGRTPKNDQGYKGAVPW